MYPTTHITHTILYAEAHRDELLREARRFRIMKQQDALRYIGEVHATAPHPNRLRQAIGHFLITTGQRVQGLPQPNFTVNQYSVGQ